MVPTLKQERRPLRAAGGSIFSARTAAPKTRRAPEMRPDREGGERMGLTQGSKAPQQGILPCERRPRSPSFHRRL